MTYNHDSITDARYSPGKTRQHDSNRDFILEKTHSVQISQPLAIRSPSFFKPRPLPSIHLFIHLSLPEVMTFTIPRKTAKKQANDNGDTPKNMPTKKTPPAVKYASPNTVILTAVAAADASPPKIPSLSLVSSPSLWSAHSVKDQPHDTNESPTK